MRVQYHEHQALMQWLYAGPFVINVSDRYTSNYCVPFEPYQDLWDEAAAVQEQASSPKERETCTLFGQTRDWTLAHIREVDRQLTWTKFADYASALCSMAFAYICTEESGKHHFTLRSTSGVRVLVNGKTAFVKQVLGRSETTDQFDAELHAGRNSVSIMLLNVHIQCVNTFQLMMDKPCTMEADLLPMPGLSRAEVEKGFDAFYFSSAVLLPGQTQHLCADGLPTLGGEYAWTLKNRKGQALAQGKAAGGAFRTRLAAYEELEVSGSYCVELAFACGDVSVTGPKLSFQKIDLLQNVPDTDYQGRRAYLQRCYAMDVETTSPRHAFLPQIARMACGRPDLLDEKAMWEGLAYINERNDCADFSMHALLRFYIKYASSPAVSDELREAMRQCILNFKYWEDEPGRTMMFTRSENHEILFYSAEYIAGLLFPAEIFPNSGQNGLFHVLKGRMKAEQWMKEKGHYGFTEWHSNNYYDADILALLSIYDFGEAHSLIRQLAKQTLDLIALFTAANSANGIMATTHGRCYELQLMHPYTEKVCRNNYLFFGEPKLLIAGYTIGSVALVDSDYQPPEIAEKMERHTPMETRTCMGLFREEMQPGVVCSTYRTAHYMVSGMVESKAGEFGAQIHAGQVLIEGSVPVFVTCFADRSTMTRPSYFGGQYRVPKTIAYRDMLAYIYHIESEAGFTHCYFPQEEFDQVCRSGSWMFGRKGEAYVGVYCSQPFTETSGGVDNHRELLSMAKDVTWIIQMGDKEKWPTFESFMQAMSTSQFTCDAKRLLWHSPAQGQIALSWVEACTHDGQPFRLENEPLLDNPMVHADYGSGKIRFASGEIMNFFV